MRITLLTGFAFIGSCIGALWWIIATALLCFTSVCALLQPFLQKRRATNAAQPPVSAILPVKITDPGFREAEASIFAQDYPNYEVLFSAAEAASPALDIVNELAQTHATVPVRIMQSHCDSAVSPKLNVIAAPLVAAEHDFILTKDSNIIFDPDMLAVYMQNFAAGVGVVVGVPVAEQAETISGHIEAFLINGHARLLLTTSAFGFGFGVGKAMMFRRSDLEKIGGFDAISYTLAEDTAISRGLAATGLKTVFAHCPLRQVIGHRTWREIYNRQLRWAVIRRAHEPITFPLEPFSSPLPAAIGAAIGAPLIGLSPLAGFGLSLLIWFAIEIGVAALKGWDVSPVSPIAFLGREILALSSWLRAWTTRDVTWANGRLNVAAGTRAAAAEAALSLRTERTGSDEL
ncbi:MAG TPA: glycosyltransferase [Methylovirgula sp.]|nr:glycosyltransferase [Methylovirgula sp.]